MANQLDLTIWRKRQEALDKAITDYDQWLQGSNVPRASTFRCLLKNLQAFAKGQFDFFCDGFGLGRLREDQNQPPAYVLWATLDQVASDLGFIQQAVAQRLQGTQEMRKTLNTAEALALLALSPVKAMLDPQTTVLAYFQKFPSVRVIPYAPVALIGFPFTCTSVPRDYLAIPHEVGHYVFWRGKSNGKRIRQILKENLEASGGPEWVQDWGEEIFADIYGYLSAGPLMALSCQDLQLSLALDGLIEDDGEHPLPAVRPYVYTTYLEKKGQGDWGDLAGRLKRRWDDRMGQRKLDSKTVKFVPKSLKADQEKQLTLLDWLLHPSEKKLPTLDEAITQTGSVIDTVSEQLGIQTEGWFASLYVGLAGLANLDNLYSRFEDRFNPQTLNLPAEVPQELQLPGWSWTDWLQKIYSDNKVQVQKPIPVETWLFVLLADGWATKIASSWRR